MFVRYLPRYSRCGVLRPPFCTSYSVVTVKRKQVGGEEGTPKAL